MNSSWYRRNLKNYNQLSTVVKNAPPLVIINIMQKSGLFILLCSFILVLAVNPVFAAKNPKPVELEIPSYDGFKMHATLNVPKYASIKNKAPLVIFIHSIGKSRIDWYEFPEKVRLSLNAATLNVDLRGHGKSDKNSDNKALYWQDLKDTDFQKMPEDIIEALKFLQKEYPEVDSKNIAIIGSSLGASVGLMSASYDREQKIKTVIMLSPMLKYKGFDLRLPIVDYGQNALLIIVSEKDRYPYESGRELIKFGQGKKLLQAYPFGGHGEDLLKFQPKSQDLIVEWLADSLKTEKTEQENEESKNRPKFKYKEVGEYSGEIKVY